MRSLAFGLLLAALISAAGCASSVAPLYTKADTYDEPLLAGTWITPDNPAIEVTGLGSGAYRLDVAHSDSDMEYIYTVHIVKLGGNLFGDMLFEDQRRNGQTVTTPAGLIGLHQIWKMDLSGDDLTCWLLDENVVEKAAQFAGRHAAIP